MKKKNHISDEDPVSISEIFDQLNLSGDISYMAEEMREDIYLELNRKITTSLRKKYYLKIVSLAASIALLIGLSTYFAYEVGYKQQNSQFVTVANPLGMQSSLILGDGTKVFLNAGTSLTYPAAFVSKTREVIVNGEAYFEVSHDKDHPFIVQAENVRVQVLGTRFNVKAYQEEKEIAVTLEEGSVGVRLAHQTALIRMEPGEQLSFDKVSGSFTRREINLSHGIAWREKNFHFENTTFEEIARELERRFNVHIEITSEELKKIRFTGDFVREENLDQILNVITADRRTGYETDPEDNIIRIYDRQNK